LVTLGARITESRHAGVGRDARSRVRRSLSHPRRWGVRGGVPGASADDDGERRRDRVPTRRSAHDAQSRRGESDAAGVDLLAPRARRTAAAVVRRWWTNVALRVRLFELRSAVQSAGRGAAADAAGPKPR